MGGKRKNLSVYSSIDTAPVCSFLGWNTEKSLAKKSKHLLCALNQRRIRIITLHIQSLKIWWKFEITFTNHLLWISICFWGYSPMISHCCILPTEERSPEPNSSDSCRGSTAWGAQVAWEGFADDVQESLHGSEQGEPVPRTFSCISEMSLYFPMPILIGFFKLSNCPTALFIGLVLLFKLTLRTY